MTRVLLTGGSGDLGLMLSQLLPQYNCQPVILDVRAPRFRNDEFIECSVLDRQQLPLHMSNIDVVVHIAAWHGIHEERGLKSAYDFFDLNVRGTFEVFEAALRANVSRVVLISSTSVLDYDTLYARSKMASEVIAGDYARCHNMRVVTLRPRAFIPHWNHTVYEDYLAWLRYFWKGAVHINDVAQATLKAIERTAVLPAMSPPLTNEIYVIDGAYDYSAADLADWDEKGPGSTFSNCYPDFVQLALQHQLPIAAKPTILGSADAEQILGYRATYSLRNALQDLRRYGVSGPPFP